MVEHLSRKYQSDSATYPDMSHFALPAAGNIRLDFSGALNHKTMLFSSLTLLLLTARSWSL